MFNFCSSHSADKISLSITGSGPFSLSGVVFRMASAAQSNSRILENLLESVNAASTLGDPAVCSENFENFGGHTSSLPSSFDL